MEKLISYLSIPTRWQPYVVRIGLGFAVVLLFLLHSNHLIKLPLINNMEGALYDMRLRATMPDTLYPQVVIIDIDEKSLQQEGRWPWSRARMGDLIQTLTDHYKVAVVGIDVVFAEPESLASLKLLQQIAKQESSQNKQMSTLLAKLQIQLDGDQVFAKKIQQRNVVLGYFFMRRNNFNESSQTGELPTPSCDLAQLNKHEMSLQQATGFGANLALLQNAAAGGGHFIPNLDADGIIRTIPLLMAYQGKCYEALSLAIVRRLLNTPKVSVEVGADPWSKHTLNVGELSVPVAKDGSAWIPYRGYQPSYKYISASDVLNKKIDRTELEDVVTLLGTTAAGLLDLRETPVGSAYAGVEAHANMVSGMLENNVKKSPTALPGIESWMLLLLGIFAAVLLGSTAPMHVMWIALASGAVVFMANIMLWIGSAVVLPLASPLLLLCVLFVLNVSYGFLAEERTKRLYKERFGQYVSPEVIEEMIDNPELTESMEGSSRNMTVLFSDIRNFTTISEGMESKDLMRMMNEYLTPMTRLIIDKDQYQGTIDKYIGDAIMAFWGAPLFDAKHAQHGVLAALDMQRLAAQLTIEFKAKGWAEIRIGVGLNTGAMSVGNMGSSFRRAYTVLGDSVNLAARLEGLTKEYGVGILVSESTKDGTSGIVYRELDRVRVKGKELAVRIYEPIGLTADVSPQKLALIKQFDQALVHYRAQQWDAAISQLKTLPVEDAVLVNLYLKRITEWQTCPPEKEWDGVTVFTTK
jgi:adenylate cyclase